MYQQTPMVNFNKNNPFIVIAKRKYDQILDSIQLFGSRCIRNMIINIIILLITITLGGIYIYKENTYILIIISVFLLIFFDILCILLFRRKIKYFMTIHPNMKEFDRVSSAEVNDILTLNNEDVLKCVNGLYELHGELTATIKYYNVAFLIYYGIELVIAMAIALNLIF